MIFGTDGIRSTFGEGPLRQEVIARLSKVISADLGQGVSIVLGMDTRESGPQLKSWLCSCWEAIRVLDLGVVPTPVVAFETKAQGADLGVMVTASHNPFQDNGLKFFTSEGIKISKEIAIRWSRAVEDDSSLPVEKHGKVSTLRPHAYESFLKNHFEPNSLPLVLDLANGAASPVVAGWVDWFFPQAQIIGNEPDGTNINHQCGALHPQALGDRVVETGACAGFALDGDGDRLVVVDAHGQPIHGDRVLYALASMMKDESTIVSTIMAGKGLEESLEREGKTLVRTAVGDQNVLFAMLEQGARIGGESSGHYISSELFPAGDGFLHALKLANALKDDPNLFVRASSNVPIYPQIEKAFVVQAKPPLESLPGVSNALASLESAFGGQGRCILRYSGTEKKLRLFVEAKDLDPLAGVLEELEKAIVKELQS